VEQLVSTISNKNPLVTNYRKDLSSVSCPFTVTNFLQFTAVDILLLFSALY